MENQFRDEQQIDNITALTLPAESQCPLGIGGEYDRQPTIRIVRQRFADLIAERIPFLQPLGRPVSGYDG